MKKIVLLFVAVIFGLLCVSCSDSIVIEFEENGGTNISDMKISSVEDFKLPENPTKEGYVFKGWYTDSEFKNIYNALDLESKAVTLYAKWEKEVINIDDVFKDGKIDVSFNTSTALKVTEDSEAKELSFDTSLSLKGNKLTIETINDAKAEFNLFVKLSKFSLDELEEDVISVLKNGIGLTLIYEQGYLYVVLPKEIFYQVKMKININEFIDFIKESLSQLEADTASEKEESDGITNIINEIKDIIESCLEQNGISKKEFEELFTVLSLLIPTKEEDGNSVKYTITDAQVKTFIDEASLYLVKNIDEFTGAVVDITDSLSDSLGLKLDYIELDESRKYVYGENGLRTNDGEFIPFSSITEHLLKLNDQYYCHPAIKNYIFDSNQDFKALSSISNGVYLFVLDLKGYFVLPFMTFHDYKESFHNFGSCLTENDTKYFIFDDEIYTNDHKTRIAGFVFDTGQIITKKDYEILINSATEGLSSEIEILKSMFKINELTLTVNELNNEYNTKLVGDITINKDDAGNKINVRLENDFTFKYSNADALFTDYNPIEFIDFTETIKSVITGLING